MKIIKQGEKGQKETRVDVEAKTATCIHQSAHPSLQNGASFQVTWIMDLSQLTEEQLLEAAAEYFLIKARRDFVKDGVTRKDGKVVKVAKPDASKWDGNTIDCASYVTKRTSPVEKARKALAGFTDEQLAALGLTRVTE